MSELPRLVKLRPLPAAIRIEANRSERAALAERFGVEEIRSLVANVELEARANSIAALGLLTADIVQDCAFSGEPFAIRLEEPIDLLFVETLTQGRLIADEIVEVDLDAGEGDEIEYSGDAFDLGEAVAQTLGLAIDPYAEGPQADRVRAEQGLLGKPAGGAFAALEGLFKPQ